MDLPDTNAGKRIKKPAANELVDTAFSLECGDSDILFEGMSRADIAHVVMLIEERIIPDEPGKNLLRALLELDSESVEDVGFNPRYGDTYTNRERYLKMRVGTDTGWMHVGRARRESSTIGFILALRGRLINLGSSLSGVTKALLAQAGDNTDSLMPDFTYLQHAQPTTLAHYLLTYAYPILRDMDRIRESSVRLNMSPAGSGSTNGSALPLNRLRLAELLGFGERLNVHARDAMWRPDIPIELYSILVGACINVNRLVEELEIWSSSEFNMVELDEQYCRTSVIMPQKKNPYGLAYFRGLTGLIIGKAAGMASILKTVSGQPDNRIFAYGELPRAIDLCTGGLDLVEGIISSLTFNKDVLRQQASRQFSCAADIAEALMLEFQLDYATCHTIVGEAVRAAIARGLDQLTPDLIELAAGSNDIPLDISGNTFLRDLEPATIVESRTGAGGASRQRVAEMIDESKQVADEFQGWLDRMRIQDESSKSRLIEVASNLLNSPREGTDER